MYSLKIKQSNSDYGFKKPICISLCKVKPPSVLVSSSTALLGSLIFTNIEQCCALYCNLHISDD